MSNPQLDLLISRLPALEPSASAILQAFKTTRDCIRAGGKILICGNGGSAADAEHWAGELLKGFKSKRPLNAEMRAKLPPELAEKLQGAIPMIPLTGFISLSTAFANDVDPQLIFAQLVYGLGKPGDVLIGISTSGNATNVCSAFEVADALGLITIALTGETGGKLKALSKITIHAPATETYLIQELHLPIYHCLCLMLEDEFFG
ncbi:MAG: SIS domain-containing protein, partial [Verrucomicrobiota bacterium]